MAVSVQINVLRITPAVSAFSVERRPHIHRFTYFQQHTSYS